MLDSDFGGMGPGKRAKRRQDGASHWPEPRRSGGVFCDILCRASRWRKNGMTRCMIRPLWRFQKNSMWEDILDERFPFPNFEKFKNKFDDLLAMEYFGW